MEHHDVAARIRQESSSLADACQKLIERAVGAHSHTSRMDLYAIGGFGQQLPDGSIPVLATVEVLTRR